MIFRRPPRKRVMVLGFVGAFLVVLTVIGTVLWARWTAVPEYWKRHTQYLTQTSPEQLEAIAHTIEVRVLPEWSAPVKPGGDGVRTISASFEEINAWLVAKLDRYLRNQGVRRPDWLEAVMVTQRDGQLVLAASIDHPRFQQILSVFVAFPLNESQPDTVEFEVTRIVGGRLTLPGRAFAEQVRDLAEIDDDGVKAILEAIANDERLPTPVLPIDGTREAKVLGVAVRPDGLDVTVRVQLRGDDGDTPGG